MSAHVPSEHEIETSTGAYVNLVDPDPATITIDNIAHALGNICRFGGHPGWFYSVAEHAVDTSRRVAAVLGEDCILERLAGLHHDSGEAFLGDIPRPLKGALGPRYRKLSDQMDAAVCAALKLPFAADEFKAAYVKAADNELLGAEAYTLLPSRGEAWGVVQSFNKGLEDAQARYRRAPVGLQPITAKHRFIREHTRLIGRL